MKISLFELMLKNEARKSMDLTIPIWYKYHFKEVVEMVKGCEEKYTRTKKLFE
jgi:fructose-1,6-bisphosphatase